MVHGSYTTSLRRQVREPNDACTLPIVPLLGSSFGSRIGQHGLRKSEKSFGPWSRETRCPYPRAFASTSLRAPSFFWRPVPNGFHSTPTGGDYSQRARSLSKTCRWISLTSC